MSRSKKKTNTNSIVNTDRFPTFPYAKRDNNNVSLTPPRSPTRAILSRQDTSYRTVTPKNIKKHTTQQQQQQHQ